MRRGNATQLEITIFSSPHLSLFVEVLMFSFFVGVLYFSLNGLGRYLRRNVIIRKREKVFSEAFPDFCYQPFADSVDIAGLSRFPEFEEEFHSALPAAFRHNVPEIYHLIDDVRDGMERSVFDLRVVYKKVGESSSAASTASVFLITLPTKSLLPFSISRDGIGYAVLWGEDPDIDIEGEFVFSQNYFLTGPDRGAIAKFFNKSIVSFFRSNTATFTNGMLNVNPDAILFRYAHELSPGEIREKLDILMKLIEVLSTRVKEVEVLEANQAKVKG